MKSIFKFINYRKYLETYYNEKKQTTRYFSTRYFAQKAGISSASFLREVIDGKKNLSKTTVKKFAIALNLSEKETRFFTHLVFFNQAKNAEEKQTHYAVLLTMIDSIKEQQLTVNQHQIYNYWYVPVIRELACIIDFKDNFTILANTLYPQITPREAKKSVSLLCRLGLLKKIKNGRYEQTNKAIQATTELDSMAIFNFTNSMAENAIKALKTLPKSERNFSTMTCGMSKECYEMYLIELQAFKERIIKIINQEERSESDLVYQMNFQLFPVSTQIAKEKE